jgi:chromosome segregation ATPase
MKTLEELKNRLLTFKEEIEKQRDTINSLKEEKSVLENKTKEFELHFDELRVKIENLEEMLSKLNNIVTALEGKVEKMEDEISKRPTLSMIEKRLRGVERLTKILTKELGDFRAERIEFINDIQNSFNTLFNDLNKKMNSISRDIEDLKEKYQVYLNRLITEIGY